MLKTCTYFDNFEFDILMQVVLGATLSRLLPLQLGFECFQCICLNNLVCFDQSMPFNERPSVTCYSMCGSGQDSGIMFGSVSHLGWT